MAVVRTKSKIKHISNTEKDVEVHHLSSIHAEILKLQTDSLSNKDAQEDLQQTTLCLCGEIFERSMS